MKVRLVNIFLLILLLTFSFNFCSFAAQKDIEGPLPSFFNERGTSPYIKFEDKNPKDVYVLNTKVNQSNDLSTKDNKTHSKTPAIETETSKNPTLNQSFETKSLQNYDPHYVNQISKTSVNSSADGSAYQSNMDIKTPIISGTENNNSNSNESSLFLPNTSEKVQPGSENPDIMGYLIRFFVFLILLVLVPLLIVRKLRSKLKVDYSTPRSSNGFVRVVDRIRLSYSELFIVEVMDKYLLLSVSKDGEIRLLREFDTIGIFPEKENSDKKLVKSSFLDVLRRFRQEVKQLNKS
ncbi:hypothetical protein Thena_0015 [Thermodesulfobium narugense DSM 14796]|uniref:Flagellar biosynthesis protein FliO n=1 Tax=Thermodesulfobium narugense DSM 14796 TaxID=747365 RepID=M1E5B7_9BACT|nr:flagellar biosynthetic protein FliO [Thermodesulfobium narugense]AEE13668.1 hypothetical protein Thena_0015 [Thermodesulfobium narugense DSM 14796]